MKQVLKDLYMFIFHPYLTMFLRRGKHLFIGRQAKISTIKYIDIGKNCRVGHHCRWSFYDRFCGHQYSPQLILGNDIYIGDYFTVLCADKIEIEDNVLIASYVTITSENHGINPEYGMSYAKQPLETKSVRIGEGAWIGEKAIILPGVHIGKWSVVAAGAVVTKDVEDMSIVAGNPAKKIKEYDAETKQWKRV